MNQYRYPTFWAQHNWPQLITSRSPVPAIVVALQQLDLESLYRFAWENFGSSGGRYWSRLFNALSRIAEWLEVGPGHSTVEQSSVAQESL